MFILHRIAFGANTKSSPYEQQRHRTGTSRLHISNILCDYWPRGFGEMNLSPHSWIFTSFSVDFGPSSYLFTSATVRIPVHAALECGTESIWYVTRHFRDQHVAASVRYRNRAEITVLICEQKPYPTWFSCRRKSHPIYSLPRRHS